MNRKGPFTHLCTALHLKEPERKGQKIYCKNDWKGGIQEAVLFASAPLFDLKNCVRCI